MIGLPQVCHDRATGLFIHYGIQPSMHAEMLDETDTATRQRANQQCPGKHTSDAIQPQFASKLIAQPQHQRGPQNIQRGDKRLLRIGDTVERDLHHQNPDEADQK